MTAYIISTATIRPQFAAVYNQVREQQQYVLDSHVLETALDPAHNPYLTSSEARRLSRFVRLGVHASLDCLHHVNRPTLDGIAVGTGLGGEESAEKFLHSFIHNETQTLSPSPFFQSLPNNVSGQIALSLGSHAYNMTYSHRGFSFESALVDGMLLLSEQDHRAHVMVGGVDEAAPEYHRALATEGMAKQQYERVETSQSPGFVLGGGATFLILSSQANGSKAVQIRAVDMIYNPLDATQLEQRCRELLSQEGINPAEISVLLSGRCGDRAKDDKLRQVEERLFAETPKRYFKNLCGEYHTASAFGVWYAVELLKQSADPTQHVLLINQYNDTNYSIILLRC